MHSLSQYIHRPEQVNLKTTENHLLLCLVILVKTPKELEAGTGRVVNLSKHLAGQRTDCVQELGAYKNQAVRTGKEKTEKRWR